MDFKHKSTKSIKRVILELSRNYYTFIVCIQIVKLTMHKPNKTHNNETKDHVVQMWNEDNRI